MGTNQTNQKKDPDMIIRGNRPIRHFTVVNNAIINNETLTYRARGILIFLLSKPDGWTTSAQRLANQYTEGRDAINTSIKELEDAGYMELRKTQDEHGHWSSHWLVYDEPVQKAVDKLRKIRRNADSPRTGKPNSENQGLYKELTTKDLLSEQPKLCGYCQGQGVILNGFMGLPMVCPDCKGDAIQRD